MTTILAYTSPAVGHLYPISALLVELGNRGHRIALRTLAAGVETGQQLGFATKVIDARIDAMVHDDWTAANPRAALKLAMDVFARRAAHEVADLQKAIAEVRPDALIIDAMCWGAASVADAADIPWLSFCPFTPFLRSRGVPPFGPGLRPWPGLIGRFRDDALRPLITGTLDRLIRAPLNRIRADVGAPPITTFDEFLRRAPLMLVAGAEPFEYPHPDWGDSVQMIGACAFDPAPVTAPQWLEAIEAPIVLVTTSSERQGDTDLATTTMLALADEPVHIVATMPAGLPERLTVPPNATARQFVPHSLVLQRAACAVTHGGMGATQKALAHGVPVCAVPFGRDQFEVARRVEVAACGTRLPAKKLTTTRLRNKIHQAMSMTEGARRVADGFTATGGVARGADLIEHRLLRHDNPPPGPPTQVNTKPPASPTIPPASGPKPVQPK
ncbi:glycosyltransferase [Mycolicibacterium moriokaense]|uniref:MGT family glycosyltransferase n=1 Tax=Mycolicibacterium moriokaense TaxID=39691 RepID=A0A318H8P2_9MYCO|nr:nucleotide disphospho-sugar-binding domain-containing protein [Mycolicibacterium moriokaense]PXX01586.1 MGT family glycosyltransferase [Mycolicibacterium moriokaense]